ncbi:acyl-CoA thioesterase [Actinophytocola algeriensis]|uniref:Acyl-CoA thioester hydrolase n=1 Tax=Actinophytocola algeriensis TaxID=1768010 RepID=A0A7W7VC32_9PSEU|nr:thioesterase family protein [Actinophytocola algeriensis]MBB4904602.1 acyl-CoA thioester hydrolase [Actinophytocola algeriensis]MBE1476539.1 acyl-CoA thioester hydrolase [Actinophytocola algeriensis]
MSVFVHRLRVRYSECDQQGVVFNGHYLFYYDNALTELWRDRISPYQEMVGRGFDVVVAEATLRYRSAARFDEVLDISMPVAHLGNTSLIIRPEYRVGERLVADGEMRHVFVDSSTLVPKPMPDDIRSALSGAA